MDSIIWFERLGRGDVSRVGGKNASLGEMIGHLSAAGVDVPPGFATTAAAFWRFIDANGLRGEIASRVEDWQKGAANLAETGDAIRRAILRANWPDEVAADIVEAYRELSRRVGTQSAHVAVRSSATAEDLPNASFAGQQDTFLNISGESELLAACKRCFASLFNDRAISYRQANGFDQTAVALSIGIQQMVRSDLGASGVMFSLDTETGFDKVVVISAAWGLGENVVQGAVDPDEYQVFKPLLANPALAPIVQKRRGDKAIKMICQEGAHPTRNVPTSRRERSAIVLKDEDILSLARWAVLVEGHYGQPMDMEWARDGETGRLYMVQARPETSHLRRQQGVLRSYSISGKGAMLASGVAVGDAAVSGEVCLIEDAKDIDKFVDGAILVTRTTDPDWFPIMKRAAAIVTDLGGRTSHAAIVSRELGLPAIVGAGDATQILHTLQRITVSCAEGDVGYVYEGDAQIKASELDLTSLKKTRTQVMLNLANPGAAFRWWGLPADGVGLARMEFVIANEIVVHPMALLHFDEVKDEEAKRKIAELTAGYASRADYFVDKLSLGLARLAASAYPRPGIVRMSDFKTNEYADLLGGAQFEPREANPMIGFRGASRYYSPRYRDAFALECRALRRLREVLGFRNIVAMVPFCRTTAEADKVLEVMAANGLERGRDGLEVYVMCEIPANVVLAAEFAKRFDGFSIGSNDLTQLVLGVDRDAGDLSPLFNEEDEAVKRMIAEVIASAHKSHVKIGLCGQAPSDNPDFAAFLVECGIDSISVSPDSFVAVKTTVADAEGRARKRA